jgi:membrane protein
MKFKTIFEVFKTAAADWSEDKVPRLGAALSYYTIFSIAPLIVIATAVAAFFLGAEAAQGQLDNQLRGMIGESGADAIQDMVASASKRDESTIATILGVAMLLLGASGVFAELQGSLNTIWEVEPKPNRGLWGIIRDRFFSLTMVLGTCFLLLVSLVISTAVAGLGTYMSGVLPGSEIVWGAVNAVVSFAVIAVMFALIYKYVPDVKIAWRDVWIGAVVTALLFEVGKWLIGLYLGRSSVASAYGAAGSLAILLIWVYYVSQIFFFGAEFTQVFANRFGSRVVPSENAVPLTEEARAQQGLPHHDEQGVPRRTGRAQTQRGASGETAPRPDQKTTRE